jgi:formiminotetrahydrofolate cyclodeaminase
MPERANASKLAYLPVAGFIQHVASRDATPGGGAVAALNGSLGASLLVMVSRLTAGKKKHQDVEAELRERADALVPLRDRLKDLVDEDAAAFDAVMDAYALPAGDDAAKAARDAALQAAYGRATRVPLEVMRLCLAALEHGPAVARKGTEQALSDALVAGLALHTGFVGAAYNVRINLRELPPGALRHEAELAIGSGAAHAEALLATIRAAVDSRLEG